MAGGKDLLSRFLSLRSRKKEERGKRKVVEEKEKLDPGYLFSGEKEEGGYDKYSEQILAFSPDCMGEGRGGIKKSMPFSWINLPHFSLEEKIRPFFPVFHVFDNFFGKPCAR